MLGSGAGAWLVSVTRTSEAGACRERNVRRSLGTCTALRWCPGQLGGLTLVLTLLVGQ